MKLTMLNSNSPLNNVPILTQLTNNINNVGNNTYYFKHKEELMNNQVVKYTLEIEETQPNYPLNIVYDNGTFLSTGILSNRSINHIINFLNQNQIQNQNSINFWTNLLIDIDATLNGDLT